MRDVRPIGHVTAKVELRGEAAELFEAMAKLGTTRFTDSILLSVSVPEGRYKVIEDKMLNIVSNGSVKGTESDARYIERRVGPTAFRRVEELIGLARALTTR